ncbi:hypothetical protein STEG23_004244, partial [Scotinomys teguina]
YVSSGYLILVRSYSICGFIFDFIPLAGSFDNSYILYVACMATSCDWLIPHCKDVAQFVHSAFCGHLDSYCFSGIEAHTTVICVVAFVMKKHLNTHLLGKHGVGTPKESYLCQTSDSDCSTGLFVSCSLLRFVLCCVTLSCPVLSCPVLCYPVLSRPVLCYPVLCCPVLCCVTLSCAVLSCPVLCYPVLCCPVLCCVTLSCAVLSCPVLCYPVLCCPVLCCVTLSCPVLSCPVLCYLVLSCPVLCYPVLCCAVLFF